MWVGRLFLPVPMPVHFVVSVAIIVVASLLRLALSPGALHVVDVVLLPVFLAVEGMFLSGCRAFVRVSDQGVRRWGQLLPRTEIAGAFEGPATDRCRSRSGRREVFLRMADGRVFPVHESAGTWSAPTRRAFVRLWDGKGMPDEQENGPAHGG